MKKIALLLASVAAVGALSLTATAAQADEPVGGLTGPTTGCGLHLDHEGGPGFYAVDEEGDERACDENDALAEAGL